MFDSLAIAFSPTAWLIVLLVVLLLFGGTLIPKMMKGLGQGVKDLKKGIVNFPTKLFQELAWL